MKKKFIVTSALCGLCIAAVLAAARFLVLHYVPLYLYSDDGDWFNILTLIAWPSAFYLTVLQDANEPARQVFFTVTIAVLFNAVIYSPIGWAVWRLARFLELFGPD